MLMVPRMRNPDLNQSEHLNNMKCKEPLKKGVSKCTYCQGKILKAIIFLKNKRKCLISLLHLDIKNKQQTYILSCIMIMVMILNI